MWTRVPQLTLHPIAWLVAFYGIVILQPSLWSDDYAAISDPQAFSSSLVSDLRPGWALLHWAFVSTLGIETYAWFPKILSTIFVILTYRVLTSIKVARNENVVRTVFAACLFLPSVSIFVHWSTFWQNSLAFFFSIYSLKISVFLKDSFRSRSISLVLFSMSLLIYPPSAFASFGILGIYVLIVMPNPTINLKIKNFFWITAVSAMSSFLIADLVRRKLNLVSSDRIQLTSFEELPEKILYISKLVFASFNIYSTVRPSEPINLFFGSFCMLLFLAYFYLSKLRLTKACILPIIKSASICLLSLAPVIVTKDNQIELRIMAGLAIYVTFFTLLGCVAVLSMFGKKLRISLFSNLAPLCIVFLALSGALNVNRYVSFFVSQYESNLSFVKSSLEECTFSNFDRILIVNSTPPPLSRRLGIYSLKSDFVSWWVPPSAPGILDRRIAGMEVLRIERNEFRLEKNNCVMDLHQLYSKLTPKYFW